MCGGGLRCPPSGRLVSASMRTRNPNEYPGRGTVCPQCGGPCGELSPGTTKRPVPTLWEGEPGAAEEGRSGLDVAAPGALLDPSGLDELLEVLEVLLDRALVEAQHVADLLDDALGLPVELHCDAGGCVG